MIKRILPFLLRQQCSTSAISTASVFKRVEVLRPTRVLVRNFSRSCVAPSVEKSAKEEEFDRLLSQRRPALRKRRPLNANAVKNVHIKGPKVVAIALSESLNLQDISHDSDFNTMYNVSYIDEDYDGALHLVKKLEYTINVEELSEIFVFQDGVAVFWNVDSVQQAHLLRSLENFAEDTLYESKVAMDEKDNMRFTITDVPHSCIKNDTFMLSKGEHERSHRGFQSILERFALSQAFAASVKVGVWEAQLNELAEPLSQTTKDLTQGRIPWSRKEALQKSGQFAALRHSINLDCTLLNTDFYWDRVELEKFYKEGQRHFTLTRRLNGLNNRLDYCEELVKMVDNTLGLRHASFLEWLIIILIVIEVIFDGFHFLDCSPKKVIIVKEVAEEATH